jgi:Protein of unknown function (DUF3500)
MFNVQCSKFNVLPATSRGPVVLIEFDHQRPANLSRFAVDSKQPTRQHIHVVVRTPNGNDYGKDLLR